MPSEFDNAMLLIIFKKMTHHQTHQCLSNKNEAKKSDLSRTQFNKFLFAHFLSHYSNGGIISFCPG